MTSARRASTTVGVKLFLTSWILFGVHFATNIQREHYPAMAFAANGTLRCDDYEPGFHSDIFRAKDGHAYIGNNHGASLLVAPLLKLFNPLLDALERREKAALEREKAEFAATSKPAMPVYDTKYANRARLLRLVHERGWTLRFGAVAAITATLFVAPLSALCVVLTFGFLLRRGVAEKRAALLALLFGFATPVFFRSTNLTNNMPVMYAVYGAFLALWTADGSTPSTPRHALAGLLCGTALFCDYAAVVPCLCFGVWTLARNFGGAGKPAFADAARRVLAFGLAALPPIFFLLLTQKLCYGGWFIIGQQAMPKVNYTDHGWLGFDVPSAEIFGANMVDPRFGLFAYAPFLALGVLPPRPSDKNAVIPWRAWHPLCAATLLFLLFCAGNQYSKMQFNTGVRYLMPVVPFFFLSACNRLATMSGRMFAAIAVPSVLHAWVVTMGRDYSGFEFHVGRAWEWIVERGPRLPWLHVLQSTSTGSSLPSGVVPHLAVLAVAGAAVAAVARPHRSAIGRQEKPQ